MSLPKQTIGLTNFAGSITKCPPNPDAIRAIVFTTPTNLAVVNGAITELQLSLSNFFIPVKSAAKLDFTVFAKTSESSPYVIQKLSLGGVDVEGEVKAIALFPQFGTTCSGNSTYLEWAPAQLIDSGTLETVETVGITGNSSLNFFDINKLSFSWGTYLNYNNDGGGILYAATNGGLLMFDGSNISLKCTLNSDTPTDFMNSLDVDPTNVVWIASNMGILNYSNADKKFKIAYDTSNSPLLSNNINDIKIFNTNSLVASTDSGLFVHNIIGETANSYTIYNSPLLKHKNIGPVHVLSDTLIFAGTTGGVYILDSTTKKWCVNALNSSTIPNWTAPSNVTSIAAYNNLLYVGTTGGLVTINISGITGATTYVGYTASVTVGGGTGPASSNISSIRLEKYGTSTLNYELYIGHGGTSGKYSVYNVADNSWYATGTVSGLTAGSIKDVIPDFLSGSTGTNKTLFLGNANGSGIYKVNLSNSNNTTVPNSGQNTDLLVAIPSGLTAPSTGDYRVDTTHLYSINQPMLFAFSKNMSGGSVQNFFSLNSGITGGGSTVSGSWSWSSNGTVGTYSPADPLSMASSYNVTIAMGSTASDGTYLTQGLNVGFYTQDINPEVGWFPLGKILFLSGSDNKYIESIYLRNPQSSDINVTAIIGK